MVSPLPLKSELLKPLSALANVHLGGRAYFTDLRNSNDPYLVVAAWCSLVDGKLLSLSDWPQLIAQCGRGAIRSRAFAYFQDLKEHSLAAKAAETPLLRQGDILQELMLAETQDDSARLGEL